MSATENLKTVVQEMKSVMFNLKNIILHHNTRPQAALRIRRKIVELGWEVLSHSPYSPDRPTITCFFITFSEGKKNKTEDKTFFKNGISKLSSRWQEIIDNNGN